MRKIFLWVLVVFLAFASVFAFNVSDINGNQKIYYSINDPVVIVQTTVNLTNFTVNYNINREYTKVFNFSKCESGFCGEFSLLALIQEQNGTFSGSTVFNISVANSSKNIFLDFERPTFNFLNSTVFPIEKILKLNFNYSDNSKKISSAEIYLKDNYSQIFLSSILNRTFYNYSINRTGNLTFIFKIKDEAGNIEQFSKTIFIKDIFAPKISALSIMEKEGKFDLHFMVTDDESLAKYEIIQNNLVLSENIFGKAWQKNISLPFRTGNIVFKVSDANGNSVNRTLSLLSPITVNIESKYSNKKVFQFYSNSDECYLTKFGILRYNTRFNKSLSSFSTYVSVGTTRDYPIEFYCSKGYFTQYFSKDFFYDVNPPSLSNISVKKENSGNLDISWTKSIDNESNVVYTLYRDSSKIYEGNRLMYVDSNVRYPNNYTYYLQISDEAGNIVRTEEVSAIPKKVNINFNINLKKEQEVHSSHFLLKFKTDINSNVIITLKNAGKILSTKFFKNTTNQNLETNFTLQKGINEFKVDITDDFGNHLEQFYYVTYDLLSSGTVQINLSNNTQITSGKASKNAIKDNSSPQNMSEVAILTYKNPFFWFWIIFWLIILGLFVWFFVINEFKLGKDQNKSYRYKTDKKYFAFLRYKDNRLNSSLEKIKKQRAEKQFERQKEVEREKLESKKKLTEFEKKKREDLSISKKDISIPFELRKRIKKKTEKLKKATDYNEVLLGNKTKEKTFYLKEKFGNLLKKKSGKDDMMQDYLQKVKNNKSWDLTSDYVSKQSNDLEKTAIKPVENFGKGKKESNIYEQELIKKKNESKSDFKLSLDDYLNNRNKRKRYYFMEKEVERDLKKREL